MKTIIIFLLTLIFISSLNTQAQVSINTDGSDPDSSAGLDVKFTDKGFLPPRMTNDEIYLITNPAEGLTVYNTDLHKPVFFDGTTWRKYDGSAMLAIGDFYSGGVIFYLDGSGGGFVCAVSDQSSSAQWGCYGIPISGADGTAIGTGAQNTIDIEAGCTEAGIAAEICADLSLNGYTDWFLPSKDELNEMYLNKATIDATAIANGGAAFAGTFYWSSSEHNNNDAWYQVFTSGDQNYDGKDGAVRVRAVRAF